MEQKQGQKSGFPARTRGSETAKETWIGAGEYATRAAIEGLDEQLPEVALRVSINQAVGCSR